MTEKKMTKLVNDLSKFDLMGVCKGVFLYLKPKVLFPFSF